MNLALLWIAIGLLVVGAVLFIIGEALIPAPALADYSRFVPSRHPFARPMQPLRHRSARSSAQAKLGGLVFNDGLAERVIHDPFEGRQWLDRELLPIACGAWELSLAELKLEDDDSTVVWPTLKSLWAMRDAYVHRADSVSAEAADMALACASLLDGLLEPLAVRLRLA